MHSTWFDVFPFVICYFSQSWHCNFNQKFEDLILGSINWIFFSFHNAITFVILNHDGTDKQTMSNFHLLAGFWTDLITDPQALVMHCCALFPNILAWNRFCTRSCPNIHLHHCFYIHRSSCAKHYSSTTSTTRLSTTERLVHQSHLNPITYLHTLPRNVNCGSVNCTGKAI